MAVRILRKQQRPLMALFIDQVAERYVSLMMPEHNATGESAALGVMANDDTDELLAIMAVARRFSDEGRRQARALTARIAEQCQCQAELEEMPLAVSALCHAFNDALGELGMALGPAGAVGLF